MRLLIIEDNPRLAGLIAQGLGARGFACDCATDLASADAALASAHYDALILDLGLPDGDGRAWLHAGRTRADRPPTLILTARGALEDRVAGLDAGADDYLIKPVEIDELTARVRAILRRPGSRAPVVLTSGGLVFDSQARTAACDGQSLDLSRREIALLELLMRREGTVVERGVIDDALYTFNEPVTPNAIDALVSRLRRKLDETGAAGRLHTVRGVGYLLAPPPPASHR